MPVLDDIAAQVARNESNTGSKAAPASGSTTSVSELSLVLCAALSAFADQVTARPPPPRPARRAPAPRPPPAPGASPLAPRPSAHRLPRPPPFSCRAAADSPHRRVQTRRQPRAQRQNRTYEVRRRPPPRRRIAPAAVAPSLPATADAAPPPLPQMRRPPPLDQNPHRPNDQRPRQAGGREMHRRRRHGRRPLRRRRDGADAGCAHGLSLVARWRRGRVSLYFLRPVAAAGSLGA